MNKEIAKKLYDFIFHVGLDGRIELTNRDNYHDIFSNRDKILRFNDFETAVDILSRTGEDREKIEELLNKE